MDQVHFLNIEYLFLRIYEIITGVHVDVGSVPATTIFIGGQIAIAGLTLAALLLAVSVYYLIKLTIVEHEGFHAMEGHHAASVEEAALTSRNPQWEQVMKFGSSSDESDWRRAILEADIMLGNVLSEKGFVGNTIGDQLKTANPQQFTTLDLAWSAHKMRNAIAHLGEAFPLSERDTRATIEQYARVFEEFGIL